MDFDEQTDAFRFDLDDLCERYLEEFDINTFTLIGALEEKKLEFSKIKSIIDDKVIELLGEDIEFEPEEGFFDD
jgi:hypothetical protein